MHYLEAIFRVLVVGLIFGAGLPAVFAGALVAYSNGAGGVSDDGTTHAPNPVVKYLGLLLFVLVGAIVLLAVLWITKDVIAHHTGVNVFAPLGLK